jgi:hypothetical protein
MTIEGPNARDGKGTRNKVGQQVRLLKLVIDFPLNFYRAIYN